MSTDMTLREAVLRMLDKTAFRAANHLIEELKAEFPLLYRQIVETQTRVYALSNCGSAMSPFTAVNAELYRLLDEGLAEKKLENGTALWRLSK